MELYSGRLDIISTKEQTKKDLANFFKSYGSNEHDFIACYEDKTKAGLPCKPHVHFLFYSDKTHDRMRKTLSGYGYKGPLGSLSKVASNSKWSKETTYSYVLKQQTVLLTNLEADEIEDIKEVAQQKNEAIQEKMETFHQHWTKQIVPQLIYNDINERAQIVAYVHKYITQWNKLQSSKDPKDKLPSINYPIKNTLIQLIVNFEGEYLPEEIALERYMIHMGITYTQVQDFKFFK